MAISPGINLQTINIIVYCICGVLVMMLLNFVKFEKTFPTVKTMRLAWKKGKQVAFIHDPNGAFTAVQIDLIPGSGQLDFKKKQDELGIKFKPRLQNEAEFLDRRLPIFHYLSDYPHSMPVGGFAALSRIKRIAEARGVLNTPEAMTTLMHRDLDQPTAEIRKTMVPGSIDRINDDDLGQLTTLKKDLKEMNSEDYDRQHGRGFVFGDAQAFLYSVGMSATNNLREWKSFITATSRGEIQARPGLFVLDARTIVMILIGAAIAYVISQSGSFHAIQTPALPTVNHLMMFWMK